MRIDTYTIGIDVQQNINDSLKKIDTGIIEAAKGMDKSFSSAINSVQGKLQAIRLPAFAIAAGGLGIFKSLTDQASEGQEAANAINVVFGDAAKAIFEFSKESATAAGISGTAFQKLAINTGALLKDTGISAEELGDSTVKLAKRAADMASVFDTDVNDAMSAINQALRGETEAIRRYAGDVTDASLQTFLLSKGINKNVKDLKENEKRLYRLQLILHQTNVTAGDFANTSESSANQMRIQAAQTAELTGSLGQRLLPVLDSILRVTNKVIEYFSNLSEETLDNIVLFGGLGVALSAATFALSFIIPVVTGIITALKTLGAVLKVVFITNPIIAGIAAISASIFLLWDALTGGEIIFNKINTWFTETFPSAARVVKDTFRALADAVNNILNSIAKGLDILSVIPAAIASPFEGLGGAVKGTLSKGADFFSNLVGGGSNQTTTNTNRTINIDSVQINSNAESIEQLKQDIDVGVEDAIPIPAGVPG